MSEPATQPTSYDDRTRAAVEALAASLREPAGPTDGWRWGLRRAMAGVRDALVAEDAAVGEGWLAARGGAARRERDHLLERLGALGDRVMVEEPVERVREDVRRLVTDVEHHRQRVSALAWDDVELELGGSD